MTKIPEKLKDLLWPTASEGFVSGHVVPYAVAEHNGEKCVVVEHLHFTVAERVRDSMSQSIPQ